MRMNLEGELPIPPFEGLRTKDKRDQVAGCFKHLGVQALGGLKLLDDVKLLDGVKLMDDIKLLDGYQAPG